MTSICEKGPIRTSSRVVRQLFNIIDGKSLSYSSVARKVGLSNVTLSYWKAGRSSPTLIDFENALSSLGYELRIVRRID